MVAKIIALWLFFGFVLAEPIQEIASPTTKESRFMSDLFGIEPPESRTIKPEVTFSINLLDVINAVVGKKSSMLLIAVDIMKWLVSKSVMIVIGAVITFGFCKLTDKCNFDYEQYVPVAQFKSLATPELLAGAERLLVTAVEKYADNKKGNSR